jgi:hypothetical protein
MEVIPEEPGSAAESAAAALSRAERRAVDCFAALLDAEHNFKEGVQFGHALIELRDEIKDSHGRNFKKRLEELEITYAKARYWIAVVVGKPISRGKKIAAVQPTNWDAATAEFEKLSCDICDLYSRHPDGSEGLVELLHELAAMFGYQLVKQGGKNA